MRRVVDHQCLGVDALEQMGGGHISEVEGRVLPQQDNVELGELHALRLAQGEMIAGLVAHAQRLDRGEQVALSSASRSGV